jgi:hypothetical protein
MIRTRWDWEQKYAELVAGEGCAWYWHTDKEGNLSVVGVSKDGHGRLQSGGDQMTMEIDYPNGPKCLTPMDIEAKDKQFLRMSNLSLKHYRKALAEILELATNYPDVLEMRGIVKCAKKALGE